MAIIATDVSTLPGCNTKDGNKYLLLNNAPVPADTTDTLINYIDRRYWKHNSIQFSNTPGVVCTLWISANAVKWSQFGATQNTDAAFVVFPPGCYPYIGVSRDGTTAGNVTATLDSQGFSAQ